jgi:hypothetical protein
MLLLIDGAVQQAAQWGRQSMVMVASTRRLWWLTSEISDDLSAGRAATRAAFWAADPRGKTVGCDPAA